MPIQFVGGKTGGGFAGGTGTFNVSLTDLTGGIASSPAAGDFVVVVYAVGTAGRTPTLTITGNNNGSYDAQTAIQADDTYDARLVLFTKRMGSTPDTQYTRSGTGNIADGGSTSVLVFRGVDPTTPFDVASVTATGTNTSRADPPSITPTTSGAFVVVSAAGAAGTLTTDWTTSGLSGVYQSNGADTNDGRSLIGYVEWTSGPVDIAQFGGGSNTTSDSWASRVIALRPEAATPATANPTGVAGTGAAGTAAGLGKAAAPVSGATATGAAGTSVAVGAASAATTGVSATGAVGTTVGAGAALATLAGVSATGAAGTATGAVVILASATGVSATGAAGAAAATGAAVALAPATPSTGAAGTTVGAGAALATVTGVSATGAAGSVGATGAAVALAESASAPGEIGAFEVFGAALVEISGVSASEGAGTPGGTGGAVAPIDGLEATTDIGEVVPIGLAPEGERVTQDNIARETEGGSPVRRVTENYVPLPVTVSLTGVSATGAVGTPAALFAAAGPATGVSASGAAGTPVAAGAAVAPVPGVSASGAPGAVVIAGVPTIASVTGAAAAGATGDAEAIIGVRGQVVGVSATGAPGTVVARGAATVVISGAGAVSAVDAPTVILRALVDVGGTAAGGTAGVIAAIARDARRPQVIFIE